MADAVTSQTIIDTEKRVVMKFTNLSDGNGESAVKKVDVSALTSHPDGTACSNITIDQIWYDIGGMRLLIDFAASTNVAALSKKYLYLTTGDATEAAYTAGKLVIKITGAAFDYNNG